MEVLGGPGTKPHDGGHGQGRVLVDDGELRVEETTLSKQRKNVSVYNTVETLNKHPSIFINYLRVLAGLKGIKFQIQAVPEEQKGQPKKKKKTKKNAQIEQILTAKDLAYKELEELSFKKRAGKTTTQENLQVDKWYWHHRAYEGDPAELRLWPKPLSRTCLD